MAGSRSYHGELILTGEERQGLRGLRQDARLTRFQRLRAAIVLEAGEGVEAKELSKRLGCNEHTAGLWRARWATEGLRGLRLPYEVEQEARETWARDDGGGRVRPMLGEEGLGRVVVTGCRWGEGEGGEERERGADLEGEVIASGEEEEGGVGEEERVVLDAGQVQVQAARHPASLIRTARLYYCLGFRVKEIGERLQVPWRTVYYWRDRKAPDGLDWAEYKEILGAADVKATLVLAGGQEQRDFELKMLGLTDRVLAVVMAGLTSEWLYDDAGQRVDYLRDEQGQRVAVGMVTGMKVPERVKLIKEMASVRAQSLRALKELEEGESRRFEERRKMLLDLGVEIARVLGVEAWERVEAALRGEGESGEREGGEGDKDPGEETESNGQATGGDNHRG